MSTITRKYTLEGLDCANCAMKIEDAIKQINGVNQVNVSFLTQKLTIETEENIDIITEEILKVIKKVEPDCKVIL